MTKYYDTEVAEKTNEEVQKKANFEKMMLAMDEENKNKEVDMSQFPTYDFKANEYELFASIDQLESGRFVAYVLKENGKQWYLIDENQFKPCDFSEVEEVTQPQMQFYRKRNVKIDLSYKLEAMMMQKNKDLGVYRKKEIKENIA